MADGDIADWLTEQGLEVHASLFADNRIDFDVLTDLSEADLRELGLPLGDRKRLMKAIEALANIGNSAPGGEDGERREVAVMFADISGFTRLAVDRDAEEVHQLLNRFFAAADAVVQSFGGYIDKHIGDAVMAVFGAPTAHTDDPERAVRAALAVHDAVAELDPPLRVHIGVAAGQVVASRTGSAAHLEYTVTGDTVNLASRLTDLAKAGETLVSDAVQSALQGRLTGETLGEQSVPGIPDPVSVWRADGLTEAPTFATGLLVGRRQQVEIFTTTLEDSITNGNGQTYLIRGDAGIGKSRIVQEFQRLAVDRGIQWHSSQALDFGVGEGQDAISMLLRSLLGLALDAGVNQSIAATEMAVETALIKSEQKIHLNDLLNLPQNPQERVFYDAMDNEQRSRGRVETVVDLVIGLSARAPQLLCIEELHWSGPGMLVYLTGLASVTEQHPVSLLLTSRIQGDPFNDVWRAGIGEVPLQRLDLDPLTVDEATELADLVGNVDKAHSVACIERSGGNPFFLEQLLRSTKSGEGQDIPGSVQSVVQSRIDGLSPGDRTALQAASIVGQYFPLDAVRFVMNNEIYEPDYLIRYHLVRRAGRGLQFYHALFRDAVQRSFLRERRQSLHLRAADWYQDRDVVLYAEHLAAAGSERAPIALERAARSEAAAYRIERALELVDRGLSSLAQGADQFSLTVYRAELLRVVGQAGQALASCKSALNMAKVDTERCKAWIGMAAASRMLGQGETTLEELAFAQSVAEQEGLTEELAEIFFYRGTIAFAAGQFEDCLQLQTQSLQHARQAGSHKWEATAEGGLGDAQYACGRMRLALEHFNHCLALCQEYSFLDIQARNQFMRGVLKRYLGDQGSAIRELEDAASLLDRIHDVRGAMLVRIIIGEILVDRGDPVEAGVPLFEALEISRSLKNQRMEVYTLYELARREMALGEVAAARQNLDEALKLGHATGIGFHGPRLFGLRARLAMNDDERHKWLKMGENLLEEGANAHNFIWFHRDAIDACLGAKETYQVRYYCSALEKFVRADPLPWAEFFVARGQGLADFEDGHVDPSTLETIREQCHELGLFGAMAELEEALT